MPGTINLTVILDITDPAGFFYGPIKKAKSFTITEMNKKDIPVAASSTLVIWDRSVTGIDTPADFDVLVMWSDVALDVEMTINEGDANEELISFTLAANVPFILGDDAAYYNHSASNVWGGALGLIDKIRVRENAAVSAQLTFIMGT